MSHRPDFFEPIREKASQRWDQLESDPELAGPWHQLFKQVQSPRHILSELLQNADDAGATEASVKVEDDIFLFEHNGEDFTEEHFASLCRFGYSNKRALHTIGFRGIGFKSTFSLGNRVELITPSLSIAFDRDRFTEPKWVQNGHANQTVTAVRVSISDNHRKAEVEKNLKEWLKSPVSLLFFKNIRRMKIGEDLVDWGALGPGPIPNTEWLALSEDIEKPYLLARSEPVAFPDDALAEIRQERLLSDTEESDFPPCAVEIVLGVEGRLYVVLPTGVKTDLPFACNAPFIQDPARMKIKDPETSPTNRWLLQRAGQLAASTMLKWLQSGSSKVDKSSAYDWLPNVDYDSAELEGMCGEIVEKAFLKGIDAEQILLTDEGHLVRSDGCVSIPEALFDVWPGQQAVAVLDDQNRPAFSKDVSDENRANLSAHGLLEEITANDFINSISRKHLPKPEGWKQLLCLWRFIDPLINGYRFFGKKGDLKIVPVQGQEVLFAANEVIRLGEKKLLQSDEDWQFIGDRMSVVNQNWLRFLAEERRRSETTGSNEGVVSAYSVLEAIGLGEPSDAAKVVGQVASEFFSQGNVTLIDAVRMAQIAAKLGATVNQQFRYATQDKTLRSINSTVIYDEDCSVELMVPENWGEPHILHPDYSKEFTSCSREEWLRWISSGRSGLYTFVPIEASPSGYIYGRKMHEQIGRRGYKGKFSPRYKDPYFVIYDWNFKDEIWEYWEQRAQEDDGFWSRVVEKLLIQPNSLWEEKLSASAKEFASNGNSKQVIPNSLLPEWIMQLKEKACLKDTHGQFWKPSELLRRTPETEAVMDVEPFVHPLLDNENSRPLLVALGVGDMPTGPDRLLDRLRGLSSADNAPSHEVEKWYRRLDQMVDACSTEDFLKIRNAFSIERLILTEGGSWESAQGVYLTSNEEDVPGAEVIRSSVHELTFWRKIGVSDRPTADQALSWLKTLQSGEQIPSDDTGRVRALLPRHAARIWQECEHWPNLAGEWCPVATLEYSVSMQSLVGTRHLHEWVKAKTANFQGLSSEVLASFPFSDIPPLASHIEQRFHKQPNFSQSPEAKQWLNRLGSEIARIIDDNEEQTTLIRTEGMRLSSTKWQTAPGLETIAYIDGTPAGMPRRTEAVWLGKILYVEEGSMAKLARSIAQELGRTFNRPDVNDAIKVCVDRSEEFISTYMEENFDLGPYVGPSNELSDCEDVLPTQGKTVELDERPSADASHWETNQDRPDVSEGDIETVPGEQIDEIATKEEVTIEHDAEDVPSNSGVSVETNAESSPVHETRTRKTPLIERYAVSLGYKPDGENRFYNSDGSWISKSDGNIFPWARHSVGGDVLQYLKPKDHCLIKAPLELEAEVWEIIQNRPETYTLILSDIDGEPAAMSGQDLLSMREKAEITLYPATYRLVYEHD